MEKLEKYTKRPRQSSNLETNRVKFSYILIECVLPHFLIQGKACAFTMCGLCTSSALRINLVR